MVNYVYIPLNIILHLNIYGLLSSIAKSTIVYIFYIEPTANWSKYSSSMPRCVCHARYQAYNFFLKVQLKLDFLDFEI
jgi:hypothetical protein